MINYHPADFPHSRPRRLRKAPWIRDLIRETTLNVNDLILPIFVHENSEKDEVISSMPGVFRYPTVKVPEIVNHAYELGIKAVAIFPQTPLNKRDESGSEALNPENLVCRAVRKIKSEVPNVGIICDVALDPYTSHGHDGLWKGDDVVNDETVEILCKQALNQVQAGCDVIAPSDMMDGRVKAIRQTLDEAGFSDVIMMSYSAKYASSFYGPFREAVAADSLLGKKDKKTYQMDPSNWREALREFHTDINEGADILMVKPAGAYLDIIQRVKDEFQIPVAAYQVSGEYSMIVASSERGWINRDAAVLETLTAIKRAGADMILTYFALDAAKLIKL